MRNGMQTMMAGVGLVALLGLAPLQLSAQSSDGRSYDTARADELDARAAQLYNTPDAWKKVSSLHEKAASLRAPTDPEMLEDLQVAASIAAGQLDYRRAERLMAKLAAAATAVGDVERAAHSYLTAALMAAKTGKADRARIYVERAELLAHSPLLSEEACECIRSRLREAGVTLLASG